MLKGSLQSTAAGFSVEIVWSDMLIPSAWYKLWDEKCDVGERYPITILSYVLEQQQLWKKHAFERMHSNVDLKPFKKVNLRYILTVFSITSGYELIYISSSGLSRKCSFERNIEPQAGVVVFQLHPQLEDLSCNLRAKLSCQELWFRLMSFFLSYMGCYFSRHPKVLALYFHRDCSSQFGN